MGSSVSKDSVSLGALADSRPSALLGCPCGAPFVARTPCLRTGCYFLSTSMAMILARLGGLVILSCKLLAGIGAKRNAPNCSGTFPQFGIIGNQALFTILGCRLRGQLFHERLMSSMNLVE